LNGDAKNWSSFEYQGKDICIFLLIYWIYLSTVSTTLNHVSITSSPISIVSCSDYYLVANPLIISVFYYESLLIVISSGIEIALEDS
jgi:hypothetical protein